MGLKTKNYEIKSLGLTLPDAYCILHKLQQNRDQITATFAIQSTREKSRRLEPLSTISVTFKWDRQTDIAKAAYAELIRPKTVQRYSEEDRKIVDVEIPSPFASWENDVIYVEG